MADGGRFADPGNRRITEDGAVRITQHAVLLSATLDSTASLSSAVELFRRFATLSANASLTCHVVRRRNITATLTAKSSDVSASADVRLGILAKLRAKARMQTGYNVIPHRRITEDGTPRITHPPGIRVVEHNPTGGQILMRRPPFRIYSNDQDIWHIVYPSVKYYSQWQLPLHISVKNGGAWRSVVEPQSD